MKLRYFSFFEIKIKILLLVLLFFFLGVFSSSTPDFIGIFELIIIFLSLVIFNFIVFSNFIFDDLKSGRYIVLSLVYYCSIPLFFSVNNGIDIYSILRDLIPLFFVYVPFLLFRVLKEEEYKYILWGILFIGISYSFRFLLSIDFNLKSIGRSFFYGDMNYYQMDPSVLFSSLYFFYLLFLTKLSKKKKFFYSILGAFTFLPYVLSVVRFPLISILLFVFMNLILIQFEHLSKGKIISPIFILILLLIVFLLLYDFFADIFNLILAKTSKAGLLNSRDLEFKFIINSLSTDLKTFLFGMGWGSYIFSVGTSKFRYVHNIFLYFFAKSGLIGLLLLLYYLYLVFSNLFFGLKKYKKIFKYNVIYILISFLTFAFILEPCFKMFTTYLIIFVFMNTDLFFKVSAKTNQKDVVN